MASKCATCGGHLTINDAYERRCMNCGREAAPEVAAPDKPSPRAAPSPAPTAAAPAALTPPATAPMTITVHLHPRTLRELFHMLATVEGQSATRYLMNRGLSQGQANNMLSGEHVYITPLMHIVKEQGITPTELFRLIEGTVGDPPRRGPGRPKKGA